MRRLEDRVLAVEARVSAGLEILSKLLCEHGSPPQSGLHVREFHGRRITMATAPPIRMVDSERVLLAVRPRKADGTPDNTVTYTWSSSDQAQVGIDAQGLPEHPGTDAEGNPITIPATYEAWATSPLDAGLAVVTATPNTPKYTTDTIEVSYVPGTPGASNLSAGTPVPD
jgi:hypothetical protein